MVEKSFNKIQNVC